VMVLLCPAPEEASRAHGGAQETQSPGRNLMKFRKIAEWEDHDTVPGGDIGFLLEAADGSAEHATYARVSWADLTTEEFAALVDGAAIELTDHPSVPDCWQT